MNIIAYLLLFTSYIISESTETHCTSNNIFPLKTVSISSHDICKSNNIETKTPAININKLNLNKLNLTKLEQLFIITKAIYLNEYNLDYLINILMNDHSNYYLNKNECKLAIIEYKKYLLTILVGRIISKSYLVPSKKVDLVWHTHILDSLSYKILIDNLFKPFMVSYHNPMPDNLDKYPGFHEVYYQDTRDVYKSIFGSFPDNNVWLKASDSTSTGMDIDLGCSLIDSTAGWVGMGLGTGGAINFLTSNAQCPSSLSCVQFIERSLLTRTYDISSTSGCQNIDLIFDLKMGPNTYEDTDQFSLVTECDNLGTVTQALFQNGVPQANQEMLQITQPLGTACVEANSLNVIFNQISSLSDESMQLRNFCIIARNCPPPTNSPTMAPTLTPTLSPTISPTLSPTMNPTNNPTMSPTLNPTNSPTLSPTNIPTMSPTNNPTLSPTNSPTLAPTMNPTLSPTMIPTNSPTMNPTNSPTMNPTKMPTKKPTRKPTDKPTKKQECMFVFGAENPFMSHHRYNNNMNTGSSSESSSDSSDEGNVRMNRDMSYTACVDGILTNGPYMVGNLINGGRLTYYLYDSHNNCFSYQNNKIIGEVTLEFDRNGFINTNARITDNNYMFRGYNVYAGFCQIPQDNRLIDNYYGYTNDDICSLSRQRQCHKNTLNPFNYPCVNTNMDTQRFNLNINEIWKKDEIYIVYAAYVCREIN